MVDDPTQGKQALQRLTTGEPDDAQLEVAIRSLDEALEVNAGYADDRLVV